jgi:hypothetical protein
MVLSPRSLSYARDALESLFGNSVEDLHLRLITDSEQDKEELTAALEAIDSRAHRWTVYSEQDLAGREEALFAGHDRLRAFRRGHPCWRKITDPLLVSDPGQELVLLDPDLYFPNRFQFEATPENGLLLMWQQPNCLFPPEVVKTAISHGIRLAHHVDIGVAHWRASADLDWLDWLIGRLGGTELPRIMHVEAIVWAALAMRVGGGYLDPVFWKCWRRSQAKRVMAKLGVSGQHILKSESWDSLKCFHAGGEAKWWLHKARESGLLDGRSILREPGRALAFEELTPAQYARELAFKRMLQAMGYYQIFRTA